MAKKKKKTAKKSAKKKTSTKVKRSREEDAIQIASRVFGNLTNQ